MFQQLHFLHQQYLQHLFLLLPYLHALPVSHFMIPMLLDELNPFPSPILASSFTSQLFTPSTFKHTEATGWDPWSLLPSMVFIFCSESSPFSVLRWLQGTFCLSYLCVSKAGLFPPPTALHLYRLFSSQPISSSLGYSLGNLENQRIPVEN